ncbi:MAG: TetR/AcrR family transcriptional regulator C-terminal domain-containing protein [Mycobacterium sp.]
MTKTPTVSMPTAAPSPPDGGGVSRSVILRCALTIVDQDGVDGLSMRRLSGLVGRDPAVIYRHVPSKSALLDGIPEIVFGELMVDVTDPDWQAQLRVVAHAFRRLALEHPNVVPLIVTRPAATPLGKRPVAMLRPLEDVLTLLTLSGFDVVAALHVYRVVFSFLQGHVLTELQETVGRRGDAPEPAPLDECPHVGSLAKELDGYDGAAELDRGLDLLLAGLTAPRPPTPRSPLEQPQPRHHRAHAQGERASPPDSPGAS